ncbi:NUDIX hydrolase [Candidatus Woesearchaeota archaeon]|nr:NUDIX hydrolase [Candidatus Woesearchaeota archaeon]
MEKPVYRGKFITVTEEHGPDYKFERAYLLPSVQVIAFTEDGKILLIREQRKIEGKTRWKFVSGFCDKPGLSPEQVAQEELMEEAGFVAGRLVKWHELDHKHTFILPITYYLAYDLKPKQKDNPDGPVVEEIKAVSIEELHKRVQDGEFDFQNEASIILKLYREWKAGTLK